MNTIYLKHDIIKTELMMALFQTNRGFPFQFPAKFGRLLYGPLMKSCGNMHTKTFLLVVAVYPG